MWVIRNSELTESEFNDSVTFPSYPLAPALWRTGTSLMSGLHYDLTFPSYPLASQLWRVTRNGLETGFYNEIPKPDDNWVIGTDGLKTKNMAETIYLGAFANNPGFYQVTIPKSVKSIGRYAFYGTRIDWVRIARDCKYYPTSFPEGCLINFYDDDEESDNNG